MKNQPPLGRGTGISSGAGGGALATTPAEVQATHRLASTLSKTRPWGTDLSGSLLGAAGVDGISLKHIVPALLRLLPQ